MSWVTDGSHDDSVWPTEIRFYQAFAQTWIKDVSKVISNSLSYAHLDWHP